MLKNNTTTKLNKKESKNIDTVVYFSGNGKCELASTAKKYIEEISGYENCRLRCHLTYVGINCDEIPSSKTIVLLKNYEWNFKLYGKLFDRNSFEQIKFFIDMTNTCSKQSLWCNAKHYSSIVMLTCNNCFIWFVWIPSQNFTLLQNSYLNWGPDNIRRLYVIKAL